ncbi:aspartyl/glutamyl-tRNA(Asn/Gln) amidotransferase subunit B [Lishizhenia tianjinensis]|uniref:Aspartyl/glutamyl-tRNA(Asn/Gln) amidotransferase subunit B n=1 Tax=Lishizhenia tianjinensis TaxID=477690 RepID=A0A1I7AN06_9FLAO|nr:Asp-tRNA(Asn)/Glu-tRNA(Gln) amidotransferase subunit GatB [Lishizhenia tianjinensis]SFT76274.1 aspartyl/glutamyl-tRNA(Asn/Gln) amidotransferase subunit B [Lishizhenia tianjinensis]
MRENYEAVIGLEVHAQMLTKTKAYSNDVNEYGAMPNTNISAITLGHPGTLPVMNKKTIEYAIKLGLALNCNIAEDQYFARKNYFYPDLPKGYQITQDKTPICTGGSVKIKTKDGVEKEIGITRIHMEEDAGKSIHDVDMYDTLVDLNRAGTPLLEIVTEPDLRSSDEAYAYLQEVRKLLRYLEICDGNMEEGSMRCDANISVMKKGSKVFGTKVEVKNMNSMRNVQRAIEFEINRQIEALENGEELFQETRSFDALNNSTISMRSKEAANDYRYFPEPDLQPIRVTEDQINGVKAEMPALPNDLFEKYTKEYKLSEYDASNLIEAKPIALFYNEVTAHTKNYKAAANWIMGDVKSFLNQRGLEMKDFPISAEQIAKLIGIIDEGKVSSTVASQSIFPAMLEAPEKDPLAIAQELNLIQESDEDSIKNYISQVIAQHPSEVERYRNGEKQLTGFFMGQLMRLSKGKADPKAANKLMREMLEQ